MLDRAAILERSGLPDRADFEIEPHRDDLGMWRVKITSDGDPTILFSIGSATRLADEIRKVDPELAAKIDANVEKARQRANA